MLKPRCRWYLYGSCLCGEKRAFQHEVFKIGRQGQHILTAPTNTFPVCSHPAFTLPLANAVFLVVDSGRWLKRSWYGDSEKRTVWLETKAFHVVLLMSHATNSLDIQNTMKTKI